MKKLFSHLLEPRSFILGITIFYFVSASFLWSRAPLWAYHREMYLAGVLLISAVGLVIKKPWSNLLAAVMSSQFPLVFFAEFWMLSLNAEVPVLSARHIRLWIWTISTIGVTPLVLLILSAVILSFSVVSLLRRPTELLAPDV